MLEALPKRHTLVVRCLSGLGNRILALASARVLTKRHGWALRYVWPIVPVRKGTDDFSWFPLQLDQLWENPFEQLSVATWRRVQSNPRIERWGLNKTQKQQPVSLPEKNYVLADGHGYWNIDGEGKRHELIRRVLKDDFKLVPGLQARVDEFREEHFTDNTWAVQIRAKGRHVAKWAPVKRLEALIDRALKEDESRKVFLSCEDVGVVDRIQGRWGSRICATPKPPQINTPAAMKTSVVDIYLMAAATRFFGVPGSGFAHPPWLLRSDWKTHDPFDVPLP